jgi:hypothetical protein
LVVAAAGGAASGANGAAGSSVRLQAQPKTSHENVAMRRLGHRCMIRVLAGFRRYARAKASGAGLVCGKLPQPSYLSDVMFGSRTAIGLGCYALTFGLAFACGGSVEHNDGSAGPGGAGSSSGKAGSRAVAGSAGNTGRAGSGGYAGTEMLPDGGMVEPDPIDTGCTAAELPPPDIQCDPFDASSCGAGAGCYPFVDHPQGSGCDQQRYGTICLRAGQGTQGALCGADVSDGCAPGFVCVVGQRAGKRCAALCELGVPNTCKGGLICGDLDVAGFGVCG